MNHECPCEARSPAYVVTVLAPKDGSVLLQPTNHNDAHVRAQPEDREPLLMAQARRRLVEFELIERATILALTVALALLAIVVAAGAPQVAAICVSSCTATSAALIVRGKSARHERSGCGSGPVAPIAASKAP